MPHRYQQTQSGQWRCPPGETNAMHWGLEYCVRTETEIDWNLQINHLYYWHNSFRSTLIEKTRVSVKYDPNVFR
jgi:hypothetical protein